MAIELVRKAISAGKGGEFDSSGSTVAIDTSLGTSITTLNIKGTSSARSGGIWLKSSDSSIAFSVYGATSDSATNPFAIDTTSNHGFRFLANSVQAGLIDQNSAWTIGSTNSTQTHAVHGSTKWVDSNQTTVTIINNQGGGGGFGLTTGEGIFFTRTPTLPNQAGQIDCLSGYFNMTSRGDVASYGAYRFRGWNGSTFTDYAYLNFFETTQTQITPSTNATMHVSKDAGTGESIRASGTIVASSSDYAEYMRKAIPTDEIDHGEVCGVDVNGNLTKSYSTSISFVIKSTNPSYVGGADWEPTMNDGESKEDYSIRVLAAQKTVDKIAFCGRVPCIVTGSFDIGDWIVPQQGPNDTIQAVAVSDAAITFEQYRRAIGQVWKAQDDGKALLAVGVK